MRRRCGFFKPTKIENDFNFPPPETLQLVFLKGKAEKFQTKNPNFRSIRKSIDRLSSFCELSVSQKRFQF
jgi:hypothetical protein